MKPRANPNEWLEKIQREDRAAARGKLRIYFGAAAGVGKTYAMLNAARELQAAGKTVLLGLIETHGREETEAKIAGLPLLPKKAMPFQDKRVMEFDLDAALEQKPDLLLLDELAHSNIEGSRHPKRWQDVEELLGAGIDVWTTLNVQHLESLNGVISHITGAPIYETVPDSFFESANEVVLVDTTADELLQRLQAGKIYAPPQAKRAAQHFFRKGNLISLREIALRRTAQCIESDVKTYRHQAAIQTVWQTDAGVMVCLCGREGEENLIRSAARLAGQLNCEWHTAYVDTPQFRRDKSLQQQEIAVKQLRFAETLGATTALIHAERRAEAFVRYARQHNLAKALYAPAPAPIWHGFRWPEWTDELAQQAPELDLIRVSATDMGAGQKLPAPKYGAADWRAGASAISSGGRAGLGYVFTLAATLGLSAALWPFSYRLDKTNIVMFFLLLVIAAGMKYGRGVGAFAAVISVACFDVCFVPPRWSFAVSDLQYVVTFAVMLSVGLLTSQLTIYLKHRVRIANRHEQQAISLFEFAKVLSGMLELEEIVRQSEEFLRQEFGGKVFFLLPDANEQLIDVHQPDINPSIAQWAYKNQQEAGFGTHTLPQNPYLYLPLKAPVRIRGLVAIAPDDPHSLWLPEKRRQLDTFTNLIALTLERIHFAEIAHKVMMEVESEKMRNTLLSAISHDLRTPLTALIGQAQWLSQSHAQLPADKMRQSLLSLNDCARNIHGFVSNLLEMARLESGPLPLKKDWQSIEEIIGSVVRGFSFSHPEAQIELKLPAHCPLAQFDAVLIERVLANLIENSIKYSPSAARIDIGVEVGAHDLHVTVADEGKGIPPTRLNTIFDKFSRGENESANPGAGLGLSIAQSIIRAHGGAIHAENRTDRPSGSLLRFTLPLSPLPEIEE